MARVIDYRKGEQISVSTFGDLSDDRLDALLANYRRLRATGRPEYAIAVKEHNRRHGACLDIARTIGLVRQGAGERRFLSYGEIAELHGADWSKVRYLMNTHLWNVVQYAHHRGWPMLSAIIVNKQHLGTGKMEPSTLKGFISAAEQLGYELDDAETFLDEQQEACFEWAKQPRGSSC